LGALDPFISDMEMALLFTSAGKANFEGLWGRVSGTSRGWSGGSRGKAALGSKGLL